MLVKIVSDAKMFPLTSWPWSFWRVEAHGVNTRRVKMKSMCEKVSILYSKIEAFVLVHDYFDKRNTQSKTIL